MTIICDRYAFSGVAFSAAKPGLDFDWCRECDRGLPGPDAVIYLDLSVEDAARVSLKEVGLRVATRVGVKVKLSSLAGAERHLSLSLSQNP